MLAPVLLLALLQSSCHLIFPFEGNAPGDAATTDSGFVCTCAIADGTGDGKVDVVDQGYLAGCRVTPDTDSCTRYDYNGDGVVDDVDLDCLKLFFGRTCSVDAGTDLGVFCTCAAADLTNDGMVKLSDFSAARRCLGKPPTGACMAVDLNSDGVIDQKDTACVQAWVGKDCS